MFQLIKNEFLIEKLSPHSYNRRSTAVCLCNHGCFGKTIIILYSECVIDGSYPACKAHCGLTLTHKPHDFVKNMLSVKRVSNYIYNFCLKHFSIQTNNSGSNQKCIFVFMQSTCYYCLVLMTLIFLENFRIILKYNIFYENSTSESRGVTLERADRETDIKKLTVTFQNFARR